MSRQEHVHRTRVEWVDTDAAGIHHNTAVVRFVEAAEAALVRRCGLEGYWPVVPRVSFQADFTAPLRAGQEVTVELTVEQLGTSSMTLAFQVWGEPHGGRPRTRAARGNYVVVHIDGDHTGDGARSAPWPPEWRAALSVPGHSSGPAG